MNVSKVGPNAVVLLANIGTTLFTRDVDLRVNEYDPRSNSRPCPWRLTLSAAISKDRYAVEERSDRRLTLRNYDHKSACDLYK